MKKLIILLILLPLLVVSQNETEAAIFETSTLTPNPEKIMQFEKGITAHNKKYHGEGPFAVRVYWISSGPNTGSYHWVMGGLPWSAMDSRPTDNDGHDTDWNQNVMPYVMAGSGAQTYFRFHPEMSRFPKDFVLSNLLIDYYDVKRGKNKEAMALVEKIHKVYKDKLPDEKYGIYTNEFGSTKEGRDLAVLSFFDKTAWLGKDFGLVKKYDEMYGAGGFDKFLKEWTEITNGSETELWIFRPDLSGISGNVKGMPDN